MNAARYRTAAQMLTDHSEEYGKRHNVVVSEEPFKSRLQYAIDVTRIT